MEDGGGMKQRLREEEKRRGEEVRILAKANNVLFTALKSINLN